MNNGLSKMHPLIMAAAAAVILTCLVALGVMTGIIPSGMNKSATPAQELTTAPNGPKALPGGTQFAPGNTASSTTTVTQEKRTVTRAPAHEPRRAERDTAPAGATSSSTSQTVAGSGPAACLNCGTVTSVRAVKRQGDAGMIGPAAGALLGGVLGHQVGNGTGQTIATVVGAGAGAAAGTEVERRYKSTTSYVVAVRLNDGSTREFTYENDPGVQAGSKVRVVDGRLLHG
jgi:outer membrane lipoprotein SlyB